MTIQNETPGRDYDLPAPSNRLSEDVLRLITALTEIDADVTAILAALADKAGAAHTHAIADVIGLSVALSGFAPANHTHTLASLSGVSISGAASGQFLRFNGTAWTNATLTIGDVANLSSTLSSLQSQITDPDDGTF